MACKKRERMTTAVRRGYLLPYDNFANRIATLRFVQDIPLRQSVASYPVVKQIEASLVQFVDRPMMIMWGMRDFCFNEWYLEQWIARFPAAKVHRFEDAGHYVVEDAHERMVPLIREFLQAG
jgi:haloalkane dehalogenase